MPVETLQSQCYSALKKRHWIKWNKQVDKHLHVTMTNLWNVQVTNGGDEMKN